MEKYHQGYQDALTDVLKILKSKQYLATYEGYEVNPMMEAYRAIETWRTKCKVQ